MSTREQSKSGQKPWTLDDVKSILGGKEANNRKLYTQDRNGLNPIGFAALQAAQTADALTPLLELLEPPTEGEIEKIDQILALLGRIAENQVLLHERMLALESKILSCDVRSLGKPIASIVRVPNRRK